MKLKFSEKFQTVYVLHKISVFLTWLLCFSSKNLYPESITVQLQCSPYQKIKEVTIHAPVLTQFKSKGHFVIQTMWII